MDPNEGVEIKTSRAWPFNHALTMASLPSVFSIKLNKVEAACSCSCGGMRHRSWFDWIDQVFLPSFRTMELRQVKICYNSKHLFLDKLPRRLLEGTSVRKDHRGKIPRKRIDQLSKVGDVLTVLWKGTFWYKRFVGVTPESGLRYTRQNRILFRLLAGNAPRGASTRELFDSPLDRSGLKKLEGVLNTIEGVLLQLIAAGVPGLTWDYLDRVVAGLLKNLLQDLNTTDQSVETTYEALKRVRKELKRWLFSPTPREAYRVQIPRQLGCLRRLRDHIFTATVGSPEFYYRVGIAIQTRSTGLPPQKVITKAFLAWKANVTIPPRRCMIALSALTRATQTVWQKIRARGGREFRNISNCYWKAVVSLSDSAEFDTPQSRGGKYEWARLILSELGTYRERDLFTGKVLCEKKASPECVGEALFHYSAGVMRTSGGREWIGHIRQVTIPEAGKARSITVSRGEHAVFQHPMAKILGGLLAFMPSSESGMKAANHAWNFFKRISAKNPEFSWYFTDPSAFGIGSSDLTEATDKANPAFVFNTLYPFARMAGIPDWYAKQATYSLIMPRRVYNSSGKEFLFVKTNGILMGDPLTKVMMHLSHLVAEELAHVMAKKELHTTHGGKFTSP